MMKLPWTVGYLQKAHGAVMLAGYIVKVPTDLAHP